MRHNLNIAVLVCLGVGSVFIVRAAISEWYLVSAPNASPFTVTVNADYFLL